MIEKGKTGSALTLVGKLALYWSIQEVETGGLRLPAQPGIHCKALSQNRQMRGGKVACTHAHTHTES